jgi:hypothetical protein
MALEPDQALKEAGPSGQTAPVVADHDARFDKLETKINPGLAAVKARIALLEGMNESAGWSRRSAKRRSPEQCGGKWRRQRVARTGCRQDRPMERGRPAGVST